MNCVQMAESLLTVPVFTFHSACWVVILCPAFVS